MATKIQTFRKDPNAVLDYVIDWGENYLATGETISSVVWTVGTGITEDSVSKTDTTATIWLSGGTAGENYDIACKIVTNQSRTDERTFTVQVEQR